MYLAVLLQAMVLEPWSQAPDVLNVSAFKSMPVPQDLKIYLDDTK
jgi:hypothetical protein